MKQLFTLLIAFVLFSPMLRSTEPSKHVYEGEVTGVVCAACSDHVKTALSKIPSVSSVKVVKGEKEGVNKLIIEATSDTLTAADANNALGEYAKEYSIIKLTKAS
jgi:copper chaperone CopZ